MSTSLKLLIIQNTASSPEDFEFMTFDISVLTLYLLLSSVDNLCKKFGPRSGPTQHPV